MLSNVPLFPGDREGEGPIRLEAPRKQRMI